MIGQGFPAPERERESAGSKRPSVKHGPLVGGVGLSRKARATPQKDVRTCLCLVSPMPLEYSTLR